LVAKQRIINISRSFVAGFWKFAIEKSYEAYEVNVVKKNVEFFNSHRLVIAEQSKEPMCVILSGRERSDADT
jgi:hypothetical protein